MTFVIRKSDFPIYIKNIIPLLITVNLLLLLAYVADHAFEWGLTVEDLKYVLPAFLLITFVAGMVLFFSSLEKLTSLFKPVRRETWILLLLVLVFAAYFRVSVVPHTHRIFFDEDLYIGIANVIATEGKSELCNYGSPTECREGILNKEPNAYPFFVAVLYFILGASEPLVYHMFTMIGIASVFLIFLVAYLLFEDELGALFAALLLAFLPSHIVWTGSISVELFFVFFSLLGFLFLLAYIRVEHGRLLLLATVSLAFASQSRPESSLFIIVCFLTILLFKKGLLSELSSIRFWIPWMVLAILLTPHIAHLKNAEETDDWGAGGRDKKFSWQVYDRQNREMRNFWFNGKMFPQAFTVFALIGVIYSLFYSRRILALSLVWFALFFTLFLFFYAGGVLSGGIGTRFANIYSIPVILIASFGLGKLSSQFERIVKDKHIFPFLVLLVVLFSIQSTMDYITRPDPMAQYARDMHEFVYEHMDDIGPQCWTLTHNPSILIVPGKSSLQTWFGGNAKVMDRIFEESDDCVYFLEGAWCLFEPHKSGVCRTMQSRYDLEVSHRMVREDDKSQVFTIYRVRRKN
ncbi:glycosyltransferase family 39 protein [Candidatus Altiarchaeota archaeon]